MNVTAERKNRVRIQCESLRSDFRAQCTALAPAAELLDRGYGAGVNGLTLWNALKPVRRRGGLAKITGLPIALLRLTRVFRP